MFSIYIYNEKYFYQSSTKIERKNNNIHTTARTPEPYSQLILGGVKQKLYKGCLTWHSRFNYEKYYKPTADKNEGDSVMNLSAYTEAMNFLSARWTMQLHDLIISDKSLSMVINEDHDHGEHQHHDNAVDTKKMGVILDNSIPYIIGPHSFVAAIARRNNGICVSFHQEERMVEGDQEEHEYHSSSFQIDEDTSLQLIDCSSSSVSDMADLLDDDLFSDDKNNTTTSTSDSATYGKMLFDAIIFECSEHFSPVEFILKNAENDRKEIYSLEKAELFMDLGSIHKNITIHEIERNKAHRLFRQKKRNLGKIKNNGEKEKKNVDSDQKRYLTSGEHKRDEYRDYCILRVIPSLNSHGFFFDQHNSNNDNVNKKSNYYPKDNENILSYESMKNMWILGEPFFHKYYTAFDLDTNRIGLGTSLHTIISTHKNNDDNSDNTVSFTANYNIGNEDEEQQAQEGNEENGSVNNNNNNNREKHKHHPSYYNYSQVICQEEVHLDIMYMEQIVASKGDIALPAQPGETRPDGEGGSNKKEKVNMKFVYTSIGAGVFAILMTIFLILFSHKYCRYKRLPGEDSQTQITQKTADLTAISDEQSLNKSRGSRHAS